MADIKNESPQGRVISPLLLNIMIYDIFVNVGRGFVIICGWWKEEEMSKKSLSSIEEWTDRWGFKILPTKSKFMIFGIKTKVTWFWIVYVWIWSRESEGVKISGCLVWWKTNVVNLAKRFEKCENVLNIMRNIRWLIWFLFDYAVLGETKLL